MDNLANIETTYKLIDDNFDSIYAKCNADQKTALIALRDSARDAYWQAVAKDLSDNHAIVEQTAAELETTNSQIKKDLDGLKDMSSFLDTVTEGVKLAGALVTLAAAA